MTTYFTDDFADFSTCSAGDCGDWTERYNAGYWTVSSGDVVYPIGKSNDWTALTWDDLDGDANRDNIELLFKLTTSSSALTATVVPYGIARGSGSDEAETHYLFAARDTGIRVLYCSGSSTQNLIANVLLSLSASTTYWFRFRVNGSGPTSLKLKVWADGDSEPGTWNIDTTDTSGPTAAGWSGPATYGLTNPNLNTLLQIGVGTNGDTAPAAATGGATTLDAATGSYSITGQATTFSLSQSSAAGSYSATGQAANFQSVLNIAAGSYSVTGADATLTATGLDSKTLSADIGSYALTGQASSFTTSLVASAGTYSVTGQATALNINTSVATGSYVVTGVAADLIPTGISSFTLSAEAGSFSLTGSATSFDLTAKTVASSYSLTGSSATFSTTLPLQAGSYVVTGIDANLDAQISLTLSAEAGSFSLIGKTADLILTGTLQQKDGTSKKKKVDKTKEQLELERIFGKEESTEELILKFIDPVVKIPTDVLRKEVAEVAAKPTSAVLLDYLVEVKQTVAKEQQVKITQAIQQYTEAQVKIKKKKVAKKREEELLLMWMI